MKKGVIIVGLMSALLLSGCSHTNNSTNTNNPAKSTSVKKQAVQEYQNLSKANKKKIKFDFKASKMRSGYDISIKIHNETNKQVKFNLAEFKIYSATDVDLKSARDESLTIRPHETCGVRALFTNVKKSVLNDTGNYFIYISLKNKLSRFAFDIATGKDTKEANQLQSTNANKPTTNEEAPKVVQQQNESNTGESTADSNESEDSNEEANKPAKILTSANMAKALYLHSMGFPSSRGGDVYASQTAYGYKVVDNGVADSTTYYNNAGDELDASGNVIATFANLAGPTAADPEGFVSNGKNYSEY